MHTRRSFCVRAALACTAALLLLPGWGCRGSEEAAVVGAAPGDPVTVTDRGELPTVPDDAQLRRGFDAWAVLCAPCHGRTGEGDGAVASLLTVDPGDLTDLDAIVFTTDHERKQLIAEGLEGSPMIGWKDVLNDDEIEAVNAYLRYLQESGGVGNQAR